MKILVYGAGIVGSTYGWQLSETGHDVTVLVKKGKKQIIEKTGINVEDSLEKFDAYPIFKKSGDMIMTGATGANVSDLMILLTKK